MRLLADIGGTNARFALQREGRAPAYHRVLRTEEYPGPKAAIETYLAMFPDLERPSQAAFAVAGPVIGDRLRLTNTTWSFSIRALARAARLERLAVLNDFEALAWSLPALKSGNLRKIGRGRPTAGAPRAVFGPGTGLGVSCFVPRHPAKPGGPVVLATEGGHATLAAQDAREAAVIERLRARFRHVSAERVLSGPGLSSLYQAIAELDRKKHTGLVAPGEVAERARRAKDPVAREAVAMFSAIAGSFAGDLALIYGARGGVYMGGGVILRLGPAFDARLFRRRFEAKGRFKSWLAGVPTFLITHPYAAMFGLGRFLDLGRV